jgi:hypothetical protein
MREAYDIKFLPNDSLTRLNLVVGKHPGSDEEKNCSKNEVSSEEKENSGRCKTKPNDAHPSVPLLPHRRTIR